MAGYAEIPQDLHAIKSTVILGLTSRQAVCFGIGAGIILLFAWVGKSFVDISICLMLGAGLALPAFICGIYEEDGIPCEKIVGIILSYEHTKPKNRIKKDVFLNLESVNEKDKQVESITEKELSNDSNMQLQTCKDDLNHSHNEASQALDLMMEDEDA